MNEPGTEEYPSEAKPNLAQSLRQAIVDWSGAVSTVGLLIIWLTEGWVDLPGHRISAAIIVAALVLVVAIAAVSSVVALVVPAANREAPGADPPESKTPATAPQPKTSAAKLVRSWGGLTTLSIVGLCLYVPSTQAHLPFRQIVVSALLIALVLFTTWFIVVFTQELTLGREPRQDEIAGMVRFCYAFAIFTMILSVVPLVVFLLLPNKQSRRLYEIMVRSPVGLVKGCIHATKNESWELACRDHDAYRVQWVINIGGAARHAERAFGPWESPGQFKAATRVAATTSATGATRVTASTSAGHKPEPIKLVSQTVGPDAAHPDGVSTQSSADPHKLDDIFYDLDTHIDWTDFSPVIIHGGMSAPWFFICLALMGASVNLGRRIPEYQRRAIDKDDDAIDGPKVRELLEFQILQVLSAPLIAFAAYNAITPDSRTTTVALGFITGFSSDCILRMIRNVLKGVVPEGTEKETKRPAAPLANGTSEPQATV